MLLSIRHTTRYVFAVPVIQGLQRLRLKPKDTHGQIVRQWDMTIDGARVQVEYDDQHHNHTTLVSVEPGAESVSLTCSGVVDTSDKVGIIGQHAGHVPMWMFLRPTPLTRAGPKVRSLVASVAEDRDDPLALLHALSAAVRDAVAWRTGVTDVETTAEKALSQGEGVCQDQAHAFISAGRLAGVPMRYVGGYLLMDDRVEQDAGHGWAEAHVDGLGWVGFDVSNGISPDERYVRVATGCDYSEAAPVKGLSTGGGKIDLHVALAVEEVAAGQQQFQQQQ